MSNQRWPRIDTGQANLVQPETDLLDGSGGGEATEQQIRHHLNYKKIALGEIHRLLCRELCQGNLLEGRAIWMRIHMGQALQGLHASF